MRDQGSKYLCQRGGAKTPSASVCRSETVELKCQIISQKDVSIFSCLTDLSACVRVNKEMAQPFGLSLRKNKEQIIHFLIKSPAPVYRCPFVISPVSPFGNNSQCTLWLTSPAEVLEIWNQKNLPEKTNPQTVKTPDTPQNYSVLSVYRKEDCPT